MTKKIVVTGIGALVAARRHRRRHLDGTARRRLRRAHPRAATWVAELAPPGHVRRRRRTCDPETCSTASRRSASTRSASSRSSPPARRGRTPAIARGRPGAPRRRLGDRHRRRLDPARRLGHPPREGPAPGPADDGADADAERRRRPRSRWSLDARACARTVVSACASSTESIANAYEHLQAGLADVDHRGRHRGGIHPLPLASFAAMQALSKRNDDPAHASRPYDVDARRLRAWARAPPRSCSRPRSTRRPAAPSIYAEIVGGAVTSDAYHITAPDPEGTAAARAMIAALEHAGHDARRGRAHQRARDQHAGRRHRRVQGAASASSAIASTRSPCPPRRRRPGTCSVRPARSRRCSPSWRCSERTGAADDQPHASRIRRSRSTSRRRRGRSPTGDVLAISNSFGFGGHNAVVAFASA